MPEAEQVELEDSNVALIGSDTDLEQRILAAKTEEQWSGIGEEEGINIWRIEKFQVVPWPKEEYGHFYDGDSYIVLRTYYDGDTKKYDVHFWLGTDTTKDESGTAAYKTVELDDYLGSLPVQHREVEGNESDLFLSYFDPMEVLSGGIESGFNKVEPEKYEPRLLHVKGKGRVRCYQVPKMTSEMNKGDVFILDLGHELYTWIGPEANAHEKFKKATIISAINNERQGKCEEFEVNEDNKDKFFSYLKGSEDDIKSAEEGGSDLEAADEQQYRLYQLSCDTGKVSFKQVAETKDRIKKDLLDPDDIFLLDCNGKKIFIWIGNESSQKEKKNAMPIAIDYAKQRGYPDNIQIQREAQGVESDFFLNRFIE